MLTNSKWPNKIPIVDVSLIKKRKDFVGHIFNRWSLFSFSSSLDAPARRSKEETTKNDWSFSYQEQNSNRTHDWRKLIIIFVFKKGIKTKQERELRRRETSVIHDRIDNNTCQPNRVCVKLPAWQTVRVIWKLLTNQNIGKTSHTMAALNLSCIRIDWNLFDTMKLV